MERSILLPPQPARVIAGAALLVGTLDLCSAFVDYFIATGKGPAGILRYIATGAFGEGARAGGFGILASGVLFHYLIATSFTVLFYGLVRQYPRLLTRPVLTGIAYGLAIWALMNLVVVPASRIPQRPFVPSKMLKAALILIAMIGLPLAFFFRRRLLKADTAVAIAR